ncbi:MAG: preprotein translocase subunit YajC [Candidatus Omnitrophica bacterium 4484_213]|nr:MAG: preprotein translocase subunit YajC [Candidatus Omnitrophica bacterium 4484_213]
MFFLMQIAQKGNFFVGMMPLVLIFIIFYLLLIAPQQRLRKEHQIMLSKLAKGDRVVTNGGIYGTVIEVKDNIVVLRIAENTKIEIQKEAVAQKIK